LWELMLRDMPNRLSRKTGVFGNYDLPQSELADNPTFWEELCARLD